jgi:methionine synthase II (cobalamin-independent)
VPYIQIDNPHWPDYIPEDRRAAWRAIGIDPDQAMDEDPRGDNLAVSGLVRERVTLATHICRGNSRSAWHTTGGYEPIAERVSAGWTSTAFCSSIAVLLAPDSTGALGPEAHRQQMRDRLPPADSGSAAPTRAVDLIQARPRRSGNRSLQAGEKRT